MQNKMKITIIIIAIWMLLISVKVGLLENRYEEDSRMIWDGMGGIVKILKVCR
jgi:hypothetical protein